MKKKIAPSILSADFSCLEREVKALEDAGADYIHIDVMDGLFVPNITVGPLVVEAVRKVTDLFLDVHLMIEQPDRHAGAFIAAGSSGLTVHPEACYHVHRTLNAIKEQGARPAVALNPATPLCCIEHILDDVSMVLLMTVNPGFGGQAFIPSMMEKITKLRSILDEADREIAIEVDGGINLENCEEVSRAGADVFVSGSGILSTPDYRATIEDMKKRICL